MKIDTSLTMSQLPEALSQAGLQFAVATEEDFDEIMAMSQDIYGGLDYLPTRYTSWLQETNRTVILARKQGKVVSSSSSSCGKNKINGYKVSTCSICAVLIHALHPST